MFLFFFFFNDTATTEIYTLSLHDALPIWVRRRPRARQQHGVPLAGAHRGPDPAREPPDAVRRGFRIRRRLRDVDPPAARAADGAGGGPKRRPEIGRASCRGRG